MRGQMAVLEKTLDKSIEGVQAISRDVERDGGLGL